jgi:nitroreductase
LLEKLKCIFRKVRLNTFFLISRSRFLMKIYFFFSSEFDREFEYTLRGRHEALSSRYIHGNSNAQVRRCIHRLEKGLFHERRKLIFGKSVLRELERELQVCGPLVDENEVNWSIATLESYRNFSNDVGSVDRCIELVKNLSQVESLLADVGLHRLDDVSEDFETLKKIFTSRESVRFYKAQKVEHSKIENAVAIAREAPSACNRQPFHLHVCTDREQIDFVGGLAPGTAGFLDQVHTLGVVVGHASSFRYSRDRHLIYTDSGLFIGHLLPALTALGVDTCVLNWTPDWKKDRHAISYLGLDLSKTIVCLIAMGYRTNTESPVSRKKTLPNIVRKV